MMSSYDYALASSFQLELQYIDLMLKTEPTEELLVVKQYLLRRLDEVKSSLKKIA